MNRARTMRLTTTAVALAALTACGTRVDVGAGVHTAGPAGGTDGIPGAPSRAGSAPGGSAIQAGDADGTSAGGLPARESAGRPSAVPSSAARGRTPVQRDTRPIEIGIAYREGLDEAAEASGFAISSGDGKAIYDALIDEVNRTGGIAGRRVKPIYVVIPAQSSETLAQIDQRMCSTWTEDHHVSAVVTAGGYTEVLPACLQRKGVPFLFVTTAVTDASAFRRFPLMHLLYPGQYRATSAWVDTLVRQGWFKGANTRIGLLRYDSPDQRGIAQDVLKPALARHGLRVHSEGAVDSNASDGGLAAGKNILLRFQSENVTHLLPLDPNGNMTLFGMKLADSNAYYPKWALTSYVLPYIQQTNNQSQLRGSAGFGWAPSIDVDESRDPGATPARTRCLDVMRRHNVATAERTAAFAAAYSCDLLFLFQDVASRAGALSAAQISAAFAATPRFDSAAFAGFGFAPGRRDGADRARYFTFADECLCFQYRTQPFAF